tara:strand:+ start:648 stop:749 length:102 start_codon:yes stop_codon:yes gene_type:complete
MLKCEGVIPLLFIFILLMQAQPEVFGETGFVVD